MRLLIAFALLAVSIAIVTVLLFSPRVDAPNEAIHAEVAGIGFSYARAYARDEATRVGGMADRLSFTASFPAFAPLKAKARAGESVTFTVTAKDDGLDPSERPAKLYARFLTPETLDGPGGLVLRHFEQGSPYDSEELFIAPPDGRTFFARCPKPETGAPGEGCISVFRKGALDVELRFAPALLENWDALYEGAQTLLSRMTAPRRKKR
ncbi:hypothetical protein OGR47_03585 [Methylocystis sp. MJC1]|jgi:hypothetical protein|uniref:hypothetical protein n=1 Tax=Methylocystis sp. MJC1 TaxID=2654282 RepID=UPI0013EAE9DE|nr:hypothetical protein [Methylocystis sp. MJC1]KAF2990984.1 hypothetical protein MJC1_01715 [Methylocystis sp. MJC1]MBU6526096.1 hypothetical protein [Methylocystis sp. MJC1]UZX12554.1 hypothetical protein OGR47_03585 [Methylocystis sp. MJC1]